MHSGKLAFAQLMEYLPLQTFLRCVQRYPPKYSTKIFSHLDQFLCMAFAQLTYRESLCSLRAHQPKLYHFGIRGNIAKNTLADANEQRDCRIYADFAMSLIQIARTLYASDHFSVELEQMVYELDTTTTDLCLSVFPWACFRQAKAAVKMHTLLDLRGNIQTFIHTSDGKMHEINLLFRRIYSRSVDKSTGLRCDQTIALTAPKASKDYPQHLNEHESPIFSGFSYS